MLEGRQGELSPQMFAAIVCEKYGWTYTEFHNAPAWFLDVIAIKIKAEARVQKQREREQERELSRNRMSGSR